MIISKIINILKIFYVVNRENLLYITFIYFFSTPFIILTLKHTSIVSITLHFFLIIFLFNNLERRYNFIDTLPIKDKELNMAIFIYIAANIIFFSTIFFLINKFIADIFLLKDKKTLIDSVKNSLLPLIIISIVYSLSKYLYKKIKLK